MMNDVKDVWFIGFILNIVVGCYLGYDMFCFMGEDVFGGMLCVLVFNEFMKEVIKEYGGIDFVVLFGGYFVNIDRFIGVVLGLDVKGDNVIVEYFCDGQLFSGLLVVVDGGFVWIDLVILLMFILGILDQGQVVMILIGCKCVILKKVDFGMLLLGGLY